MLGERPKESARVFLSDISGVKGRLMIFVPADCPRSLRLAQFAIKPLPVMRRASGKLGARSLRERTRHSATQFRPVPRAQYCFAQRTAPGR